MYDIALEPVIGFHLSSAALATVVYVWRSKGKSGNLCCHHSGFFVLLCWGSIISRAVVDDSCKLLGV